MSHFSTIKTKLKSKPQLVEALELLQYDVKEVQVERFMDKVTQQYARMTIHNTVKDMGFEVAEEWEMIDGSIELTVNRWIGSSVD